MRVRFFFLSHKPAVSMYSRRRTLALCIVFATLGASGCGLTVWIFLDIEDARMRHAGVVASIHACRPGNTTPVSHEEEVRIWFSFHNFWKIQQILFMRVVLLVNIRCTDSWCQWQVTNQLSAALTCCTSHVVWMWDHCLDLGVSFPSPSTLVKHILCSTPVLQPNWIFIL